MNVNALINIIQKNKKTNFLPINYVSGSSFTLINHLIILNKITSIFCNLYCRNIVNYEYC